MLKSLLRILWIVWVVLVGVLAACRPNIMPQHVITPNAPNVNITINIGDIDRANNIVYGDVFGGVETVFVLPSTAIISEDGRALPLDALTVGMTIQIEGSSDHEAAVFARRILIMSGLPAPFSLTPITRLE